MVWIRRDLKKNIQFQSQPWAGTSPKLTASSSLALSSSRLGASATSLGHLFQCLTSIMGKNVFLMSDLSQAPSSWKPLSLILSLQIPLQVSCKPQIAALRGNHEVSGEFTFNLSCGLVGLFFPTTPAVFGTAYMLHRYVCYVWREAKLQEQATKWTIKSIWLDATPSHSFL